MSLGPNSKYITSNLLDFSTHQVLTSYNWLEEKESPHVNNIQIQDSLPWWQAGSGGIYNWMLYWQQCVPRFTFMWALVAAVGSTTDRHCEIQDSLPWWQRWDLQLTASLAIVVLIRGKAHVKICYNMLVVALRSKIHYHGGSSRTYNWLSYWQQWNPRFAFMVGIGGHGGSRGNYNWPLLWDSRFATMVAAVGSTINCYTSNSEIQDLLSWWALVAAEGTTTDRYCEIQDSLPRPEKAYFSWQGSQISHYFLCISLSQKSKFPSKWLNFLAMTLPKCPFFPTMFTTMVAAVGSTIDYCEIQDTPAWWQRCPVGSTKAYDWLYMYTGSSEIQDLFSWWALVAAVGSTTDRYCEIQDSTPGWQWCIQIDCY